MRYLVLSAFLFTAGLPPAASAARFSLSLFKQVGYWMNHNDDCGGTCGNHVVYITIYDTSGDPMEGVSIIDTDTGTWRATTDSYGNARFTLQQWTSYRIKPYFRDGEADSSPWMHYAVPDHAGFYSWQVEWIYEPDGSPEIRTDPLHPTYVYDAVQPNGENHSDPTYDLDQYALPADAGLWWGQTFTANCNRIVEARVQVTQGAGVPMSYQAAIYECPPDPQSEDDIGPRVSPIRQSRVFISDEYWTVNVTWGIDEVHVVPGHTYMLKIWNRGREGSERGWLNHWCSTGNYYGAGGAYRKSDTTGVFGPVPGWDLLGTVVGISVPQPADDLQIR